MVTFRLFLVVVYFLVAVLPAFAETGIAAAQSKLEALGFYYGKADGKWGDETSAAVTRFQIRQGLEINGQLNAETLSALGLAADSAAVPPAKEQPRGDAWKILRDQDAALLDNLSDAPPEPEPATSPRDTAPPEATVLETPRPAATPARMPTPAQTTRTPAPTPLPSTVPLQPFRPESRDTAPPPRDARMDEWLHDYIAAFVLAGLAPTVESELQFFAEKVDYFGDPVSKETIRRDLIRYNKQYPNRRFWLAGEPKIQTEAEDMVRVTFPLRFEVNGPGGSKSGKVLKTVDLRKAGNSLEIIAVNERGAK